MINPDLTDIGRGVIYTGNRYPGGKPERGIITSFNDTAVFVRYDGEKFAKGTNRDDLEWEHERPTSIEYIVTFHTLGKGEWPYSFDSIEDAVNQAQEWCEQALGASNPEDHSITFRREVKY